MYSRVEYNAELSSGIPYGLDFGSINAYKRMKMRFTIQYKKTDPRNCMLFVTNIETEEEIILPVNMLPTVIVKNLDNLIFDWELEVKELRESRERRIRRYERHLERTK